MTCPKCHGSNVNVQMVSETQLKKKHHGLLYWCGGWLIDMMLWICLFIPRLIVAIFKPKRYKMKTKHHSMAVCQSCGNSWAA
jgi:transcription elongation factor Elf1